MQCHSVSLWGGNTIEFDCARDDVCTDSGSIAAIEEDLRGIGFGKPGNDGGVVCSEDVGVDQGVGIYELKGQRKAWELQESDENE
jgi:hypothetical protein